MIQTIRVQGYRSLKDIEWNPGKLNVVIGTNGSVKSNLLRALAFFEHSAAGDLHKKLLRQGGIAPILWDC